MGSPDEADQVLVAVELSAALPNEDFVPFVIAGCHLKSTKRVKGEKIRLDQCEQILHILRRHFQDTPVILAADLNAEAESSNYTDYKPLVYPFLNEKMPSAYKNVRGKEPEFTSWKFRIDEGFKGGDKVVEWKYTIDFIFHSPNLKSTAVLEMPEEKEIDLPLPNFQHRD